MELSPQQIAKLTSCMKGDVHSVAKELGMEPTSAKYIRRDLLLQLTGRCLQCGFHLDGLICARCKSTISEEDAYNRLNILRRLVDESPNTVVISRKCSCGRVFTYMAEYMLAKAEKHGGNFKPANECNTCRLEKEISKSGISKPRKRGRKKIEPIDEDTRLVRKDPGADGFKNVPRLCDDQDEDPDLPVSGLLMGKM